MRNARFVCTFLVAFACIVAVTDGREQDRSFASGSTGSLPPDPTLLARTYFDDPNIRALIYDLEKGPVTRERVDEAVADTDFSVTDLLRTKILREDNGLYFIAFNYFNEADMRAIYAVAEDRVPSLVAAYMAWKEDLYRTLARYPARSVPPEVLAYVLVAGFSLNWDGLEVTEEMGWRKPDLVEGQTDGTPWRYSFWASESVPGHSIRGFFWGSSTFPGGPFNYAQDPVDFSFSSFGDPESDPRMSFPDLLYLPRGTMAEPVQAIAARIGLADRTELGLQLRDALGLELGRSVGPILFALRRRPQSEAQLRAFVQEKHTDALPDLLALLDEIQYIERAEQQYRLHFPVLDADDAALVKDVLAGSRGILTNWLHQNYDAVRGDLDDLTALRHGVAFESLFTQIWHDFFGLTTRELVAAGFMADPYEEQVRYKGALPVVWRMSLYSFSPS